MNEKELSEIIHKYNHEVGNPLTAIISLSSLLTQLLPKEEEKNLEFLQIIINEAWKINSLSESLLYLLSQRSSKSESDIRSALKKSLSKLEQRYLLDINRVQIEGEADSEVQIELEQLSYIFSELIFNGFIENLLDPTHTIMITIENAEDQINIQIKNRITTDRSIDYLKIREPLLADRPNQKRLGLGLAAVDAIIKRSENSLNLFEEVSNNNRFFVANLELKKIQSL